MFSRQVLGAACAALMTMGGAAVAQEVNFFRIGTGGTAGTYYPIGGLLANAISAAPGSRPCDEGGACGVPGLIATAVASNASVANVNAIEGGTLESGFIQGDVAAWAFNGDGIWEGQPKAEKLRAIANLYPESLHLVASKASGITSVADLKGKRVSLEEPGSGTLVDAQIVLSAAGMTEADIKPDYLKPDQAADRMKDGQMDAFFFVGGYPTGAIAELASQADVTLVPIEGEVAEKILADYSFFAADTIPAGTYQGQTADIATISVGAQWITSSEQSEELIYGITKALWNDNTRALLDGGHSKGKLIVQDGALDGLGIPLHPGAEKFYKEVGLLQ